MLPAPTQFLQDLEEDDESNETLAEKTNTFEVYAVKIPPYGNRNGWVPRTVEVMFIILCYLYYNVSSLNINKSNV